jgi:hypothetical protein
MSEDETPKKATQIRGIWIFVLACLIFAAFAAVKAYIVPAPELDRVSLAGRILLRTADVGGVFVLSMAIGLAVSFSISALRKELRSRNTTAFWLRAIGVALIPMVMSVMSTWNAVSHDRAAVIADTTVTPTSAFASLSIDRPPPDSFSLRVFHVARDEASCKEKNNNFWSGIQQSCPGCTLRSPTCVQSLPRTFEQVFTDKKGAYPYVSFPGGRVIYMGSDKFLMQKHCDEAVANLFSQGISATCIPTDS